MTYGSSSVLKSSFLKICFSISVCILIFFISFLAFLFLNPEDIYGEADKAAYNDEIDIEAESAVILEYDTGNILWGKNYSKSMHPASTTKMMSSIIAIENIDDLDEIVKIPKNASGRNHSIFRFRTGDKISLLDLIKSSLICSHNNATIALAEHVSGSVEDFVKLMNAKAAELNTKNTFFQNTSGLDDESADHKSTALDLAIIAGYCMKNELFREIVSTREDIIIINDKEIGITNTNDLLSFDYIKGIKTGYTTNAGFCIVLYSEKDDLKLITVILNNSSVDERNKDALKIINWAYNNLKYIKVVDSTQKAATAAAVGNTELYLDLYPETDYVELLNVAESKVEIKPNIYSNIDLPVKKEEILGSLNVFLNGQKIKEINMISLESVGDDYIYQELSAEEELKTRLIIISLLVFYFLIILFIIVRNLFIKKIA